MYAGTGIIRFDRGWSPVKEPTKFGGVDARVRCMNKYK